MRAPLAFAGEYDGSEYQPGDLVSLEGALYLAVRPPSNRLQLGDAGWIPFMAPAVAPSRISAGRGPEGPEGPEARNGSGA